MKPKVKRDSKNHDVIGLCVFDKNMDLLWKQEAEMPYTEKKMDNLDYSIDSQGNTYILTRVYDDEGGKVKKDKDGEANYHIELLRIKANSADIKITPIEVKDKFINGLALFESPSNYMICAGFYNKGVDLGDASGIIMFKAGAEGEIYDIANYEIPLDVLNLYTKKKNQRKNEKEEKKDKAEFQDLVLRNLVMQTDGSLILIGEQAFSKTFTSYMNGRSRSYTIYYYNDMLITKIGKDGQFEWRSRSFAVGRCPSTPHTHRPPAPLLSV